jgi:hypothetical protein
MGSRYRPPKSSTIDVTVEPGDNGTFRLTPTAPLAEGQYAVLQATVLFYDFGVK